MKKVNNIMNQYGESIIIKKSTSRLSKIQNIIYINLSNIINSNGMTFEFDTNCRFYQIQHNGCQSAVRFSVFNRQYYESINTENLARTIKNTINKYTDTESAIIVCNIGFDLDMYTEDISIDTWFNNTAIYDIFKMTGGIRCESFLVYFNNTKSFYTPTKDLHTDMLRSPMSIPMALDTFYFLAPIKNTLRPIIETLGSYNKELSIVGQYNPCSVSSEIYHTDGMSKLSFTHNKSTWETILIINPGKDIDISHLHPGSIPKLKYWSKQDAVYYSTLLNSYKLDIENFTNIQEMKLIQNVQSVINLIPVNTNDGTESGAGEADIVVNYLKSVLIERLTSEMERKSSSLRVLYNLKNILSKSYSEKKLPCKIESILIQLIGSMLMCKPSLQRMTSTGLNYF
jgi:hypothetical protein